MLYKARFFFITFIASVFLMACSTDTIKDTATETTSEESTEVNANTNSITNNESTGTHSTTENTETTEDTENNNKSENKTETKAATAIAEDSSEQETDNSAYQDAVDQFIATTGLNIEEYTFSFGETAEYIEISVYEKPAEDEEQAHTPLVGNYRYMIDTAEIMVQDYLTDAYIPFEQAEKTE